MRRLLPLLEVACKRADQIARLAGRTPMNLSELKRLQREQGAEQERLIVIGMSTSGTAPVTAAFLRQLQNDNVKGVDRLARHQAGAYRTWLARVAAIDRDLFGSIANDSSLRFPFRPDAYSIESEQRVA
jgi:hypothetical protein